ncbi:hypothetical protein BGX23_003144 [Mortierella sp. AD031]|nr:hypothetical protein BGX23_003144 [Mortierella sp. AD031]
MPFYGLPPELLQHIASFLPFHGLVRLYTSLPKIHRPIFQLLLDHSLALMMLTLEIRQLSDEQPPARDSLFVTPNNNYNGIGAARKLQTHWRVTDFDLDRLRVEFQLEEKLGLEMAERRRQEIEYQIHQHHQHQFEHQRSTLMGQQLDSSSSRGQEDIENLIWRNRGSMSSSSSVNSIPGLDRHQSLETEVSDSNFFHCNGSSHSPTLKSATVSFKAQRNMPASWISQPVDSVDSSGASTPSATSATASSSSSSVSAPVAESPGVTRARERVAAYQQNRLLLRALAKMRSREESSKLQFLPVAVELETEELGQKKVEAELVEPSKHGVHRRPSSGPGGRSYVTTGGHGGSGAVKLGRRHSFQALGSTERSSTRALPSPPPSASHYSPLEPFLSFGSDLSSNGLTKALKRILRRSSWNGNSARSHATFSAIPLTTTGCSACDLHYQQRQQHQQHQQRRSMDSLRTAVDWSSVFHSVASSMHRTSSHPIARTTTATTGGEGSYQCPHKKTVLLTTSKQQDPAVTKPIVSSTPVAKRRSFSNMVSGYRRGKTPAESDGGKRVLSGSGVVDKGKGKMTAAKATGSGRLQEQQQQEQEQPQKLFEFSYGVRHNYLHSHRLEGERVIRPMRFACSLDFFIQD